jgi:hypothetical protein
MVCSKLLPMVQQVAAGWAAASCTMGWQCAWHGAVEAAVGSTLGTVANLPWQLHKQKY